MEEREREGDGDGKRERESEIVARSCVLQYTKIIDCQNEAVACRERYFQRLP